MELLNGARERTALLEELLPPLVALPKLCVGAADVVRLSRLRSLAKKAPTENKDRAETRKGRAMQRAELQATVSVFDGFRKHRLEVLREELGGDERARGRRSPAGSATGRGCAAPPLPQSPLGSARGRSFSRGRRR